MNLSEREWYVVAGVFTLHVLLAMIFLAVWAAIALVIFLGIAWLAAYL